MVKSWQLLSGDLLAKTLRLFPPEFAHNQAIRFLSLNGLASLLGARTGQPFHNVNLKTTITGMPTLAHPIGLAAGFDKNGVCLPGLSALGFSFLEMGTLTPKAQPGNPGTRIMRLPGQRALINRLGFNNEGAQAGRHHLIKAKAGGLTTPVGVNAGKNKVTLEADALNDYVEVIDCFQDIADYIVVNLSSPNTPGLRNLANREFLQMLKEELSYMGEVSKKTWIKLDCDLDKPRFQELIETTLALGFCGVILTNTHKVDLPMQGGLSGHPIGVRSTNALEWAYEVHRGQLEMIGVGGIFSGLDIFEKLARGANAVQIYTSMVYRGPYVVPLLLEELCQEMQLRGFSSVSDVIGSYWT